MMRRLAQVVLVVVLGLTVWLVSLTTSNVTVVAPVLQDALPIPEADFGLDARYVAPVAAEPVYVLEQRASPMHRVVRIDPATGDQETVWAVPDGSLVHALSLSPDRSYLAMAVTDNYGDPGNDLVLIELATGEMSEVWSNDSGDHLTDLVWDLDGSAVWATRIRGEVTDPEGLSVIAVGVATGVVVDEIPHAVHPAPVPGGVAVLEVDPIDGSRRGVTLIGSEGSRPVDPSAGGRELDHLVYDQSAGRLLVAALAEPERIGIGLGATAEAASAAIRSSEWFAIGIAGSTTRVDRLEMPETVVYDASMTDDGMLVLVTREGLVMLPLDRADPSPLQVMASRAFRKIAA